MPLIHTLFRYSRWNMAEMFALNIHLSYLHPKQSLFFFEIPPWAKKVIIITEFETLL